MKVAFIAVIGWVCHLVAAQEKACLINVCNSLGMQQLTPGKSCHDIYQRNEASREVSGDYWINSTTGIHKVYCDMKLACHGYKKGWMRIADLDTSRGDDCPSGWTKITTKDQGHPSKKVCRSPSSRAVCISTTFKVNGVSYCKICGKARGYQRYTTDALKGVENIMSINNAYVDGLSITLGYPRKHVWTYTVGYSDARGSSSNCPCAANPGNGPYSFIENDYYCESGSPGTGRPQNAFLTRDPLWDGSGCSASNNCCSNVNMPWFYRHFHNDQNDDVEVRICTDQAYSDEAVAVDQVQLFVQ